MKPKKSLKTGNLLFKITQQIHIKEKTVLLIKDSYVIAQISL